MPNQPAVDPDTQSMHVRRVPISTCRRIHALAKLAGVSQADILTAMIDHCEPIIKRQIGFVPNERIDSR